jgi:hypothetical protein
MTKPRVLLGVCVALAVAVWAGAAAADPFVGPPICSSAGTALSGNYNEITLTGNAYVPEGATLTVRGNIRLTAGSCFDAFDLSTVHVGGNILVGAGAILGLGCTPYSIGPTPPCRDQFTADTVDGSVIARDALTMYLDGDTIHGSVISVDGGPGLTLSPYINFPIKDNVIGGNVWVSGWKGAWFGMLRNVVYGKVTVIKNVGLTTAEGVPDSTEIATNTISGDLVCLDNSPAAQLGDSGGTINTVGGQKIGQCKAV